MIEEKTKEGIIHGKRVDEGIGIKNTLITAAIILILGISAFFVTIMIYNHNLKKTYSELEDTRVGEHREETDINSSTAEEASLNVGKTVEELENENNLIETSSENEEASQMTSIQETQQNINENKPEETKKPEKTENKNIEQKQEQKAKEQPKTEEPKFSLPLEGEVLKEFAQDKLVYSETLKEWVVHTGVDIKAEKATVVKSAESGKVTAIKNDPRYGITVIIEHENGYETRYANLLTAEFVKVGEEVEQGQTIGTVGNTGAFEILDDFHLHFEILKNGQYQNPIFFIDI